MELRSLFTALPAFLLTVWLAPTVTAAGFPIYSTWPQPGGPGTAIQLTYSYGNLLDGSLADPSGESLPDDLIRSAFEVALADYAAILPIHFVEIIDVGPGPEMGEYDPAGLADIRFGQVPHVDDANAYAYFPSPGSGLAGDIVFNAERDGFGWTPVFFYAVAQHELGHSLGMGHFVDDETLAGPIGQGAPYGGPLIPLAPLMIEALQEAYGAGIGSVTPIPEPATTYLLLVAGISLFILRASASTTKGVSSCRF